MARVLQRAAGCVITLTLLLTSPGCSRLRLPPPVAEPSSGITRSFAEDLGRTLDAPLVDGNKVQELLNGDGIFPPMLEAIRAATNSVNFENFIWRSGRLSDDFIEAMIERAAAGVEVRVLVDSFGALEFKNSDERRLKRAGVQFVKYNSLWRFWGWNHRTHRKLMVVDDRVGFIGGACVGDNWLGNAEHEPLWRDTHYQVEGPVVAQMQRVFESNWKQATGQSLESKMMFPPLAAAGPAAVQCFQSGPGEGAPNSKFTYLESIRAARKSIRLAHSYFVPDGESVEALVDARQRGVKVEIMTPGVINANVVRRASRSRWRKLLEAGAEFHEFQPTAFHCKTLIVDDVWVSVGSVNFDDRSFQINDEANINVLDAEFAARQIAVFEADKEKSTRVDFEQFKQRSLWIRFVENFYGMFRSLL